MIKGLYEVHFQVASLDRSIVFYEKLGLTLAWKTEGIAFMWIEPEKSWLGLWEKPRGNHVFAKHIALGAIDWLKKRGIQPERDGKFEPIEPVVLRPEERLRLFQRSRRSPFGIALYGSRRRAGGSAQNLLERMGKTAQKMRTIRPLHFRRSCGSGAPSSLNRRSLMDSPPP